MLYNLARLHTLTVPEDTYDERCKKKLQYITELYEDHHVSHFLFISSPREDRTY